MKRPFHSRASRDVRPRRRSAARRSMVSPGARLVRVEHVGRVEGGFANVISQYDYTYDAAGRRIEIARSGSAMSESRTDAYGFALDSNQLMLNELIQNKTFRNFDLSTTDKGEPLCEFDIELYKYFKSLIGKRIDYTVEKDNCRKFARSMNELIEELFEEFKSSLEGDY